MPKIQFRVKGYVSYFGWGETCIHCNGNVFPSKRPDPKSDCPICAGMGGSPQSLCPTALVDADSYNRLLRYSRGKFAGGHIHPILLNKILREVEYDLKFHPEAEEAAWTYLDLKSVADFAADLGSEIVITTTGVVPV